MNSLKKLKSRHFACALLLILTVAFFIGSSASCNYHLQFDTSTASYDAACLFGHSSWIETSNSEQYKSIWKVSTLSFAFGGQVYFWTLSRELLSSEQTPNTTDNELDVFNKKMHEFSLANYGFVHLSNGRIVFFSAFPKGDFFIGKLDGRLSYFASAVDDN